MSAAHKTTRLSLLVGLTCAALGAVSSSAGAVAEPHPHAGKLPGFPAIRGVIPALGTPAAVVAREKLVARAFSTARARHTPGQRLFGLKATPVPNEIGQRECFSAIEEEIVFETQDMCYRGGPVLRDPKIHLIFWQGKPGASGEEQVKNFPSGYEVTVTHYFEDVAHDSNSQTNVFAVEPQYGEDTETGFVPGEGALNKEVEVIHDADTFLPSKCTYKSPFAPGPCVLDKDLQEEIKKYAGSSPKGLGDIYVVLTPGGVGGCFGEGQCAYQAYCAYHGDFGGNGVTPGQQTLYADLPFIGKVEVCDSGIHPNSTTDDGADAVIDDASHEINETISDPLGSQCPAGATKPEECEPNGWTDAIGQEVGDKCLPPETTLSGVYGSPLGEAVPASGVARSYNQVINSHFYWTQREWSNEAGLSEGTCVQRRIEVKFSISATRQATVPMTLDGSASGAPGDPSVYWVWNFGGGEQVGTASPTISHTFAQSGHHEVGLTAYDAFGSSEAGVGVFEVGAAPTPPAPPPAPAPLVIREQIAAGHVTVEQLAAKLGLPTNGKKLSGNGPFSFGRAECPPACGLTLQLFAKTTTTSHKHRTTNLVLVGSESFLLSAKGARVLSLSLTPKGKQLLHKLHKLACKLVVSVEGQEGGSWQIVRTLTIKS